MPNYLAFKRIYREDLLHYGKGHDDNPPGRGSGRYPWGSGKSKRGRKSLDRNKAAKYAALAIIGASGKYAWKNREKLDRNNIKTIARLGAVAIGSTSAVVITEYVMSKAYAESIIKRSLESDIGKLKITEIPEYKETDSTAKKGRNR